MTDLERHENMQLEISCKEFWSWQDISEALLSLRKFLWFFTGSDEALDKLKKEVQNRRLDVKAYLNLGHKGLCALSCQFDLDIQDLTDLWNLFYEFLLGIQALIAISKQFPLLEKLYWPLLLCLALSEFPHRIRPPCTTMPWTIWPALVVLWGVCWMFYDGSNFHGTFSDGIYDDNVAAILSDGHDFVGSSQDSSSQPGTIDFVSWAWMDDNLGMANILGHDQRQYFDASESSIDFTVPTTQIFSSASSVVAQNALIPPVMGLEVEGLAIEAPMITSFEDNIKFTEVTSCETADTAVLSPLHASNAAGLSVEQANIPARNSKHSQVEKYLCPYDGCKRSWPGSGFKRKDHLDQHLDGPHKRKSVPKAREMLAGDFEAHDQVSDTDSGRQSKKRKQDNETVRGQCNIEDLSSELAQERQLRKRAEKENQRLRDRVEECEDRIRKSEERIDRLLSLVEEQKGKGRG